MRDQWYGAVSVGSLALAVVVMLAACNSSGGGGTTSDGDAGTLDRADGPDGGGPTTFCSTIVAAACADFDGPTPFEGWSERAVDATSSLAIDGTSSHSAPSSLVARKPKGAGGRAALGRTLTTSAQGKSVTCNVQVRPSAVGPRTEILNYSYLDRDGVSVFDVGLTLGPSQLFLNLKPHGVDAGAGGDKTIGAALPMDAWSSVKMKVSGGIATVTLGGGAPVDVPLAGFPADWGTMLLDVGVTFNVETDAYEVRFDDLYCDVE